MEHGQERPAGAKTLHPFQILKTGYRGISGQKDSILI